jgi:solute carrier family 13 (sodium-dependent dicarboxylate transporter), member 2/3/5
MSTTAPAPTHDDGSRGEPTYRLAWTGRLGGPITALAVYYALELGGADLSPEARGTAAVGLLMAILWMTEALPLAATSLIPIAMFPMVGVLSVSEATAPYASDVIFLFMGGFVLALAMERWELHRRIALLIVLVVGTKPTRLVGGFMVATAFLSMWISNTATTVLMLPIAVSIIALITSKLREQKVASGEVVAEGKILTPRFAAGLMLAVAYAASIGSVGTLIGTPPNLFLRAFVERSYGVEIGFGQWMLVGIPLVVVFLGIAWILMTRVIFPPEVDSIPDSEGLITEQFRQLGPMSKGEKIVLTVFIGTALAWIFREPVIGIDWLATRLPWIEHLTDPAIAIIAALLLFSIPVDARRGIFVIDWETANRLPWNVLLLFGGGLSLAAAIQASGLDVWIGSQFLLLDALPGIGLVVGTIVITTLLSNLTSNTATAATFLPILGGLAMGIGIEPLVLLVPAALAATCAFIMPVATPPNAIVFGSGHVQIGQMVRAGLWLNVIAILLITLLTYTIGGWVLGY